MFDKTEKQWNTQNLHQVKNKLGLSFRFSLTLIKKHPRSKALYNLTYLIVQESR